MGYASFLAAVIVVQMANLLICKTRRLSLFQQGVRSYVSTYQGFTRIELEQDDIIDCSRNMFVNFCLIFMPVVAIALIYIPGLNRAIFLERLQ
jgi:hypothetical protein